LKFRTKIVLFSLIAVNGFKIISILKTADFSYISMMQDIQGRISQSNQEHNVLLGHFSNSISLGSGISSINDHYGTQDLEWKVEYYKPDYYDSMGEDEEILQRLSNTIRLT
jgi:hypothetical protein